MVLTKTRTILIMFSVVLLIGWAGKAQSRNEALTVPVILADYYGFAYCQAFKDRAFPYAWATAGVDALGWGIVFFPKRDSGRIIVNIANNAKTIYPIVRLADGDCPMEVRRRAWISVATHAGTLLILKFLGKPGLAVQSWAPPHDGTGVRLALNF